MFKDSLFWGGSKIQFFNVARTLTLSEENSNGITVNEEVQPQKVYISNKNACLCMSDKSKLVQNVHGAENLEVSYSKNKRMKSPIL